MKQIQSMGAQKARRRNRKTEKKTFSPSWSLYNSNFYFNYYALMMIRSECLSTKGVDLRELENK